VPIERRPRHLRPEGWKLTESTSAGDDEKADGAAGKDEAQRASGASSPTLPVPASTGKKVDKKVAKEAKEFDGNEEGGKVRGADGKPYDQSLIWALQKTFFWPFWLCASSRRRVASYLSLTILANRPLQPPASSSSRHYLRRSRRLSPSSCSSTSPSRTPGPRRRMSSVRAALSIGRLPSVGASVSPFASSSCRRRPVSSRTSTCSAVSCSVSVSVGLKGLCSR